MNKYTRLNKYTRNGYKMVQPEVDSAQPKKVAKTLKPFENIRTL